MAILIIFVLHWYLSLFTQTFFHHRYAAHQMFTMSKTSEKVFFFLSFIFQGSSYLSPYAYGILHRLHHAHADTELDPHSPKYDKNIMSMMWRTRVVYSDIFLGRTQLEEKWKKNLPEWRSFEIFADSMYTRLAWVAFYTIFYIQFATAWWMFLLLPIHFVMGPFHGAIINWFAHKYGQVRWKVSDTSKNLLPVDFLMLGESYHNNHHKHASNPNFGYRWFEVDPVYYVILALNAFGVIKLAKAKVKA